MSDTFSATTASAEDLRDEVERLRLMHSISLEFSTSLDFDELLPRVFHRVIAALGAEGGSILLREEDDSLRFAHRPRCVGAYGVRAVHRHLRCADRLAVLSGRLEQHHVHGG